MAVDIATPLNHSHTKKHQLHTPLFIAQKIKEKRYLRRIWQKTRRKEDKMKLNCANNELKSYWYCIKMSAYKNIWKICTHQKPAITRYGKPPIKLQARKIQ